MPGLSVAIYYKDRVVFSKAYGLANIERAEPLTPAHMFAAASNSKMFTASALLQLVEQQKLRLDDLACTYVPWLAEHRDQRFQEITIRQLLAHSSGLMRDGADNDYWLFEKPFPDVAGLRKQILDSALILEPNTKLKYSNLGYTVLGQIIEAVAGQPYAAYITKAIVKPLKLTATTAELVLRAGNQVATGYGIPFRHRRPELVHRSPTKAFAAAVGVYATPEDMCRFAAGHFFGNQTLLSDNSKKEMQRTQQTVSNGFDYGHQFGLGLDPLFISGRRLLGHGGHMGGHLTATYFDPHGQLAVCVMANCKDAPSTQITRGIIEALDFFGQYAAREAPTRRKRLNVRLRNNLGTVQIIATHDRIVAIDPDDWEPFTWLEEAAYVTPTTLKITTENSIFNEGELIRYSFVKDKVKSVRYAGITMSPE